MVYPPPPTQPLDEHRRQLVGKLIELARGDQNPWSVVNVSEFDTMTTIEFSSPYRLINYPSDDGSALGSHRFRVTVEHITERRDARTGELCQP